LNLRQKPRAVVRLPALVPVSALAVFLLSACATTKVAPAPAEVSITRWEESEMIGALRRRAADFRSLRALVRVDYYGPDGRSSFQEAVLVERPERMRLETLSMLGAVLIVTVNDKEILGFHPREGAVVRGARSKENLRRYTQIPLELYEITALLAGLPPVDLNAPRRQNGNALILPSVNGKRDVVKFESDDAVPTGWERFDGDGAIELSARFTDYIQTAAGLFPAKIEVASARDGKRLELRYQEPEVNSALAPELFSQQIPANVKEYSIEALGR
jgi:hypothetical protein